MPNQRRGLLLLVLIAVAVAACASPPVAGEGKPEEQPYAWPPPPESSNLDGPLPVSIERHRELLITDRSVISGARSDNASASAPWSFRHVMESLAQRSSVDASTYVNEWLTTWQASSTGEFEGNLPLAARANVQKDLVCPWLRLTPENACDESCTQCTGSKLDLARAPFRLLAIVNRLDLAETTTGCKPEDSEARFVFVALRPGTSTPMSFNAIFEYAVNGTPAGEPARWHALAALSVDDYPAALERLTRAFTDRALLRQLRTSENLAGSAWELRQFAQLRGKLLPTPLTNTVRDSLDGTPELAAHVNGHESEIFAGDNAVAPTLGTAFSTMPNADFRWTSRDADPTTLRLFGLSTCNGCHAGERGDTSTLPFAHVGVDASGATIVSRFLSDPAAPENDELGFRERSLSRRISGQCGSADASYGGRKGKGAGIPDRVISARRVH
jgi:hypothetical protein